MEQQQIDHQSLAIGWAEVLGSYADDPPTPCRNGDTVLVTSCPECDDLARPDETCEARAKGGKLENITYKCPSCGGAMVRDRWTIPTLELGTIAQFEQWVRAGAKREMHDTMIEGDVEEADRLRSRLLAEKHEYTWDGKYVRQALATWSGIHHLTYLLLRRCHPSVTEEQAKRLVEANMRGFGDALAWSRGNSEALRTGGKSGKAPRPDDAKKAETDRRRSA